MPPLPAAALLCCVLLAKPGPAVADQPLPPDVVSVLSRTAIVVADLEASKRFYSWALGYEVSFDGDITRPEVVAQLQLAPGQRAWFTVLRSSSVIEGGRRDGARILLEPMRSADGSQTELVVHDPDGIRIHVVQRSD